MSRRRGQRHRRRTRRIASIAGVVVISGATAALAWTFGTTNPNNAVTAASLATPTNPNGTKSTGAATTCTAVNVTWTASASPVNTYIVEAKTANGAWTTINADTGNVTTISDTTLYTQREVTYRVAGRYKNGTLTNWMSATATDASPLVCGSVGEVDDLTVTATNCGNATLSYSAPSGATTYDRQASTNGGAYVADGSNQTFGVWTHSTVHNGGSTVAFQVRPGISTTTDGQWSNIATVTDWGFYVESIAFGDGDGVLEPGDYVAVTFNRAVLPGSMTGTGSDMIYIRNSGTKGIAIAADATGATGAAIGWIPTTNAMGPANSTYTGAAGTGWSAGNTVWTWVKGAGANLASTANPVYGTYAVGTSATNPSRVKCSDNATNQMTPQVAPTITGTF